MTTFASPTFTADYNGLCNKIADTLNRADLLTAIPDFTVLATARIQRDMARVKHPSSMSETTLSLTSGRGALPADFRAPYLLSETDTTKYFEYVTPDQWREIQSQGWPPQGQPPVVSLSFVPGTTPAYYTLIGGKLIVLPLPTVSAPISVDLWYYADLTALSSTSTTNWALTKYPDLYLYAALVHSAPYLKDDARIATWETIYQKILADIEVEADRASRPQSKLNAARKSF